MLNGLIVFGLLIAVIVGYAVPLCAEEPSSPTLVQTDLYSKITHDCQPVDLATWSHPTRNVLQDEKVKILKVELCNGGKYPIYTVGLKYDPEGGAADAFPEESRFVLLPQELREYKPPAGIWPRAKN